MMRGRDCYKYYDPTEGNLFSSRGGEVTTQNRFSPLVEFPVDMTYDYDDYNEETPLLQCDRHDFSPAQNRKIPRRVYFSDQKDYMKNAKDYFLCPICIKDNFNAYMYENKSNCCAGYFPDFILYPFVDRQVGIESTLTENENTYGINENIDLNLDYYPEFSDGKYTKQLSNIYSKYDNYYFYRINSIYNM